MKLLIYCLILSYSAVCFSAFDHKHSKWSNILAAHTKNPEGQTLVDYRSLKMDKEPLNLYLKTLESLTKKEFDSFSKNQQLAFWINAYNAYTVSWITKHYPVKSIKDTGSLFSSPWSKEFINLFGKKMSLDDIEHETIRKQFSESRIHFAVNCAAMGCPSLIRVAFVAEKMEEQLTSATINFLKNTNKNKIKKNKMYLSKIFKWYEGDFIKTHGDVLNFVKAYLPETKEIQSVDYLDYDWKLNDYKNLSAM